MAKKSSAKRASNVRSLNRGLRQIQEPDPQEFKDLEKELAGENPVNPLSANSGIMSWFSPCWFISCLVFNGLSS